MSDLIYLACIAGLFFAAGVAIGLVWARFKPCAASSGPDIDPAGAGGPRPKPAGADMEAQAAGGPRPKV